MSLTISNENIKNLLFVLPIYAVLTSSLYLSGYWNVFNINIFEYISINEIVKLSIYPLGAYVFSQFIVTSIFTVFFPSYLKPINDEEIIEKEIYKENGFKYVMWGLKTVFVLILIVILYMAFFSSNKYSWTVVGVLIGAMAMVLISLKSFQKRFASPFISFLVGMLLLLMSMAYSYGHIRALNFDGMMRVSSINNVATKMILVGRTDAYVFLLPENFQSDKDIEMKILSVKSINSMVYKLN
jgi:hypothetical protein